MNKLKEHLSALYDGARRLLPLIYLWANDHRRATLAIACFVAGLIVGKVT